MSEQESQGCTIFFKGEFMHRYISFIKFTILLTVLTVVLSIWTNADAVDGVCGAGIGIPPFLSSGVNPNLLLVIDNSASMLDTAYIGDGSNACSDNSFDGTKQYAGLFTTEESVWDESSSKNIEIPVWYLWNGTSFEQTSAPTPADKDDNSAEFEVYESSGNLLIKIKQGTSATVPLFKASGKFLNWASASKFDIEKKILTGGKYDEDNNWLISEGRGCSGSSFIKEVAVKNLADAKNNKITLSIHGTEGGNDHTTLIDILGVSSDGFVGTTQQKACQDAINEVAKGADANQGQLSGYIDNCLAYTEKNAVLAASNAAYNHAIHTCWSAVKKGYTQPSDLGNVNEITSACEKIYANGVMPEGIDSSDSGYMCYGKYDSTSKGDGYVGRCRNSNTWVNDGSTTNPTACIQSAMWDYCGSLKIPEVIDPTSQVYDTNETWGMVGAMIDAGVVAKLGISSPLLTLKGYIKLPTLLRPEGKIQKYADKLRMGAMAFNDNGSESECNNIVVNSTIVKYCPELPQTNFDGAEVVAPIKDSNANDTDPNTGSVISHIEYLTVKINGIPATSWTPLAEGLYNALGYFGQNADLRLDLHDFNVGTSEDPVVAWCQENNILVITEGASTADISSKVKNWVEDTAAAIDLQGYTFDVTKEGECTATGVVPVGTATTGQHYLYGSTYLNDLTLFGYDADLAGIYATPSMVDSDGVSHKKNNIQTYIIKTGNPSGSNTVPDCNPATLIEKAASNGGTSLLDGASPDQLDASLEAAFGDILKRASAGSAASVISSSRSGEGAIYQAIFWPKLVRNGTDPNSNTNKDYTIEWVGDVHGLFIDDNGYMYEDSNGNRTLDSSDQRVFVYYDGAKGETMACNQFPTFNNGAGSCGAIGGGETLENVKFLWSANEWLAQLSNVADNRSLKNGDEFDFTGDPKRYIFTWSDGLNDSNPDGIVDQDREVVGFTAGTVDPDTACRATPGGTLNTLCSEFNASSPAEVNGIINWIRGDDNSTSGYRSRQSIESGTTNIFTWRLGDIIHSTPQTVAAPAEGYHLLYNDASYATFTAKYKPRRHMVYFGANDGMLHAVNAGFYSEKQKKFCLTKVSDDGSCSVGEDSAPALGTEVWAYVPYNLHSHLKCLTDLKYEHKYYVDLKPRVFDAQIFHPDDDHPEGWGTILVGGFGFGGAEEDSSKYLYKDVNGETIATIQPISSYFILDITNPEKKPVLLGEMTQELNETGFKKWADLGYSTVMPTMVIQKNATTNRWYLVFGSGPHGEFGLQGLSDQQAKVSILELTGLVDESNKPIKALHISKEGSLANSYSWTLPLPGALNGFVSDPITIDFDINPANNGTYVSDAIYFGTVEGLFDPEVNNATNYWKWGGHLFRLVMNESGHQIGLDDLSTPNYWKIKPLIDLSVNPYTQYPDPDVIGNPIQSITAAPSVGTDGFNYWIYFGTGRFFDAKDKTDSTQQSFYGIKEPMTVTTTSGITTKKLTWKDVTVSKSNDYKGLWRADQIQVKHSTITDISIPDLACSDGTMDCLPSDISTFTGLENYIAGDKLNYGDGPCTDGKNCTDGWYLNFFPDYNNRERNLGQATLLGGLVTFTTYQPSSDLCTAEGTSFIYAPYYKTGTPWHENVFGQTGLNGNYVLDKQGLGLGLTTTPNLFVGSGTDAKGTVKAFIQTSTGQIIEIKQENLPVKEFATGRSKWKEYQRP